MCEEQHARVINDQGCVNWYFWAGQFMGSQATLLTKPSCPSRVLTRSPVSASQMMIRPSSDPEARRPPWGSQATLQAEAGPSRVLTLSPVSGSQMMIRPSSDPEARRPWGP
jgi:hypothetical protein